MGTLEQKIINNDIQYFDSLFATCLQSIVSEAFRKEGARYLAELAIREGSNEIFEAIVSNIPVDFTPYDALAYAVVNAPLEMVRYIVDKGVNVHANISPGGSFIRLAALAGRQDVCKYLMERGANPLHGISSNDTNELHKCGLEDIFKLLNDAMFVRQGLPVPTDNSLKLRFHVQPYNPQGQSGQILSRDPEPG